MIAYLKGEIVGIEERSITVLVANGVGYMVYLPLSFLTKVEINTEIELHVFTNAKQDTLDLYGFIDLETKKFFESLISISGVGPKIALEALSLSVDQLKIAIENEDVKKISSIKGLGKKTAERMILELKGKLPVLSGASKNEELVPEDVIHALVNLGYKRNHIDNIFNTLPDAKMNDEELIKYFLKNA